MGEITSGQNILAGKPHTFETHWVQGRVRVTFIQGVPGGMDKTSGECSLC